MTHHPSNFKKIRLLGILNNYLLTCNVTPPQPSTANIFSGNQLQSRRGDRAVLPTALSLFWLITLLVRLRLIDLSLSPLSISLEGQKKEKGFQLWRDLCSTAKSSFTRVSLPNQALQEYHCQSKFYQSSTAKPALEDTLVFEGTVYRNSLCSAYLSHRCQKRKGLSRQQNARSRLCKLGAQMWLGSPFFEAWIGLGAFLKRLEKPTGSKSTLPDNEGLCTQNFRRFQSLVNSKSRLPDNEGWEPHFWRFQSLINSKSRLPGNEGWEPHFWRFQSLINSKSRLPSRLHSVNLKKRLPHQTSSRSFGTESMLVQHVLPVSSS